MMMRRSRTITCNNSIAPTTITSTITSIMTNITHYQLYLYVFAPLLAVSPCSDAALSPLRHPFLADLQTEIENAISYIQR